MQAHAAFLTHTGGRSVNEDACLCGGIFAGVSFGSPQTITLPSNIAWTVAVADGMGGCLGGAFAARFVLESINSEMASDATGCARRLMQVHRDLVTAGLADPRIAGCGATVAGISMGISGLVVFHVGDARVYCRTGQYLSQITIDDSRFRRAADVAGATEAHGNSLLQAIGGSAHIKDIKPHIRTLGRQATRFLLCTDGLTDTLKHEQLEEAVCADNSAHDAVYLLARAALAARCADNLTLLILDTVFTDHESTS
jgi:protein phosphatase